MAYLEAPKSTRQPRYDLEDDVVDIGRSYDCSVILDGMSVSRKHARITRDGESFFLEDLGSRRGTLINGERVLKPIRLKENDAITISDNLLIFHEDGGRRPREERDDVRLARLTAEKTVIMTTLDAKPKLDDSEVNSEAKLRAVIEITRCFPRTLTVNELLPKVLDSLFNIFPKAARGFILVKEDDTEELVPRAIKNHGEADDALHISQTVINEAMEKKQGILSADAASDDQFKHSRSIADLGIRSIMCVPLLSQSGCPLGVVQLHTEQGRRRFTSEDLEVLVSVATTTGMALENARVHETQVAQERVLRELQLARDVQQRFLPAKQPEVEGYSFFTYYQAASSAGGDYYGFIDLPGERLAISIGDVSGKGMPAAMLMARLSSDVRFSMISAPDPAAALQSVNASLGEAEIEDKFVTLLLMILETKSHALSVANAGHLHPLLRHADGSLEEVGRGRAGLPLNVSPDPAYAYRVTTVTLEPGSVVLLYTDGVTDTQNAKGEWYGVERVQDVFKRAPVGARQAGEAVLADVRNFGTGRSQRDDLTLLTFGRDGA